VFLLLRLGDQEVGAVWTAAAVDAAAVAPPHVVATVLLPLHVHLLPKERTVVDASVDVAVVAAAGWLPLFLVAAPALALALSSLVHVDVAVVSVDDPEREAVRFHAVAFGSASIVAPPPVVADMVFCLLLLQ